MARTTPTPDRQAPDRAKLPASGKALVAILAFVGVTAVAGGVEMVLFPDGNQFVKAEWLADLPVFDSWLVPGLVLGIGLGLGSLLTVYGLVRRPRWPRLAGLERRTGQHWSSTAAVVVGLGLAAWILVEVVVIPERSAIEALYGGLAVAVLVLTRSRSLRACLRAAAATRPENPRTTAT